MGLSVLLPIAQALVLFHGYRLLAVRLPDDRVAVSLKALCRMLNLERKAQVRHIQRDKDLAEQLLVVRVKTAGGPQEIEVLTVEAIASWVLGLHLSRMASAKRPLILALKVEAIQVFYGYFFGTDAAQTRQAPLHTQQPEPLPASTLQLPAPSWEGVSESADESKDALHNLQREMRRVQQEMRVKAERDEARLAALEGYQVRERARIGQIERRLAHLERVLTRLEQRVLQLLAEPFAPLAQLEVTERLMKAVIERLLLLEERVSRLEPKPPPRSPRRGRPRKDRWR
jgi:hypothetical protein